MSRIITKAELAIGDWLDRVLGPLGAPVVYQGQGGPGPTTDAWSSLRILTDSDKGHPETFNVFDLGAGLVRRYVRQRRQGTVEVLIVGNTATLSGDDLARRLDASLYDGIEVAAQGDVGLSVTGAVGPLQRLYRDADGTYTDQASIDYAFTLSEDILVGEDTTWVETPIVTDTSP